MWIWNIISTEANFKFCRYMQVPLSARWDYGLDLNVVNSLGRALASSKPTALPME